MTSKREGKEQEWWVLGLPQLLLESSFQEVAWKKKAKYTATVSLC